MTDHKTVIVEVRLPCGRFAIIDGIDEERVRRHSWCTRIPRSGTLIYVTNKQVGALHRFIMEPPAYLMVDHVNCNGLDNRRSNLRLSTNSQNQQNRRKLAKTTSRFKGVSWHRERRKWRAKLTINQRRIQIGHFIEEIDAAVAYDRVAREVFGEFARLNFPVTATTG